MYIYSKPIFRLPLTRRSQQMIARFMGRKKPIKELGTNIDQYISASASRVSRLLNVPMNKIQSPRTYMRESVECRCYHLLIQSSAALLPVVYLRFGAPRQIGVVCQSPWGPDPQPSWLCRERADLSSSPPLLVWTHPRGGPACSSKGIKALLWFVF